MAFVDYNSDLKRKAWVQKGLLQGTSQSFWTPYTGMEDTSLVYQANNANADAGHTVVFDYDGNLTSKAVKGNDTAYGKGEKKKKFSNKITVERYRLVADNGDKFDGKDINNLALTEHGDSMAKLADLFVRFKDQALFDCAQGLKGSAPTHIIDLGTTFDPASLNTIEETIKTGYGYTTGGIRRPLQPYKLANGRPAWFFMMDPSMARLIKNSSNYQSLVYNADVRGNDNRAITGVFGKIGNLFLVEADQFYGTTDNTATTFGIEDNNIEIAGLRKLDANGLWTGQTGYIYTGVQHSRGVILGANALQLGFGKMPDYKFQESTDFGITSESCLEVWMEAQKTILNDEIAGDYKAAKVANLDFGVIAVDVQVQS